MALGATVGLPLAPMEPILWRRAYEKEAGRDGGRGRCWDGRRSSVCHGLWTIGMQGEETDAVTAGGFCGAFWRGCSAAIGGPTAIGSLGCFGILGPVLVPGAPPPQALLALCFNDTTALNTGFHDKNPNFNRFDPRRYFYFSAHGGIWREAIATYRLDIYVWASRAFPHADWLLAGLWHRARRCAEGPKQDAQRQEKPDDKFGGLGS